MLPPHNAISHDPADTRYREINYITTTTTIRYRTIPRTHDPADTRFRTIPRTHDIADTRFRTIQRTHDIAYDRFFFFFFLRYRALPEVYDFAAFFILYRYYFKLYSCDIAFLYLPVFKL
jgi:hypothetical protein